MHPSVRRMATTSSRWSGLAYLVHLLSKLGIDKSNILINRPWTAYLKRQAVKVKVYR